MSPNRKLLRAVHLTAAGTIGFLVYAPADATEGTFETLAAFVFFPVLVLTGLSMWLGPRLMRRRLSRAEGRESPQP